MVCIVRVRLRVRVRVCDVRVGVRVGVGVGVGVDVCVRACVHSPLPFLPLSLIYSYFVEMFLMFSPKIIV